MCSSDLVIRVFTGKEIAEVCTPWVGTLAHFKGMKSAPQYAMAVDRACWQGEPVAAIVAHSRAEAEDALELLEVEFEELPVLADPEVDYVHINSPIPDHAWMSLDALDAGKHVMCTVPMATTIDECRQIVAKVKETGLKYMMAETVVYSREFLFIKEMYEKGELGKIQYMAASHPQEIGRAHV